MSCQDAIGVFDSGLGGLSAVKEFLHVLPNEKIYTLEIREEYPTATEAVKQFQSMPFRTQIFC